MIKFSVTGLCLGLLLLVTLTGCEAPVPDNSLKFALASAPTRLDPRFATDASAERINQLLYARLVKLDEKRLPVPGLADWQQLDDLTYRFVLRQDISTFSDGQPVTATDVVATYLDVLNPERLSPHRETLKLIDRVTAIDQYTIEFQLNQPDLLFPAYLQLGILPAELIEAGHDFDQQPVGSGPFAAISVQLPGKLLLRRQADDLLVEFLQVKDPTVRALKLLNNEVHLLQNDLSPEMAAFLSEQSKLNHLSRPGSNFTYLGFNLSDALTGDWRLRRAISLAIDRQQIIRHVFNDAAKTAEALLPPSHWAGHGELALISPDLDQARRLLSAVGYDENRRLRLVYKTSSDPFRVRLATVLQAQLAEIGIDLEIRSLDWGTFFGDIKAGNFQMYSLSWVGINTPDIFRYVFHSDSMPPVGANRGRYQSAVVDRLIDEVGQLKTLSEQAAYYRQVQAVLHDELPYVPLWYENQQAFFRQSVSGYTLAADGNYDALQYVQLATHH